MRKEFTVKLFGSGRGEVAGMNLPFDPKEAWGRARVPVAGTINGFKFRSTVAPMKGQYFICVNREMREGAKVGVGDTVRVVLEPDTAPRIVEVPADLKKALAKNKEAKAAWERYSYPHRKEFAKWITEAKKPETRERRLEKTLQMLVAREHL